MKVCIKLFDLVMIYWLVETSESSEGNEEESPDVDVDYMEDYDSEEERRQRKKKVLMGFTCKISEHAYLTLGTGQVHQIHSFTAEDLKKQ